MWHKIRRRKTGRLLPSHQRDETDMGKLSPLCFVCQSPHRRRQSVKSAIGPLSQEMPVDRPIETSSPLTMPGRPAVDRGLEPIDNQPSIRASSPSTILPSIVASSPSTILPSSVASSPSTILLSNRGLDRVHRQTSRRSGHRAYRQPAVDQGI